MIVGGYNKGAGNIVVSGRDGSLHPQRRDGTVSQKIAKRSIWMKRALGVIALSTAILFGAGVSAMEKDNNATSGKMQKMQKKEKKKLAKGRKGRAAMRSIFLIQRGLPHYSMILKRLWDDKELALSEKQKKELLAIRKETMRSLRKLKREIIPLKRDIVRKARRGTEAKKLSESLEKLAKLKEEATMTQLLCMQKTRELLSPKQLKYMREKMKELSRRGKRGEKKIK